MGKLAVPEHILNKPGKLTETEFEKMKQHAGMGADILSAVDFPYPVVPIVRHHHENWDGTGYPAGLKGTDIPIGARILSVVDCFDALTSDRPYRPRLSDDDAIRIVLDRRGTMYDPLIVETFVKVHKSTPQVTAPGGPQPNVLAGLANSRNMSVTPPTSSALSEATTSYNEMLALYALAWELTGKISFRDAAETVAIHLGRLVPASLFVFYMYDKAGDQLEATHAVGDGVWTAQGLRIQLGQRISGWVAANRKTICNSDPVLDLGEAARAPGQRLCSCLSTTLLHDDDLVGVLSLYSSQPNGFTDAHRRLIEIVARETAWTLKHILDAEHSLSR
jgi:putative methionine-R-sulfoxide reductase with GAF domain